MVEDVNVIDEKKLIEEIKNLPIINGNYDYKSESGYRVARGCQRKQRRLNNENT